MSSLDWVRQFSNAQMTNLSFYHSDHMAVKLTFGSSWVWVRRFSNNRKKRRFHFEQMWSRGKECKEIINSTWDLGDNLVKRTDVLEML